jgi:hypothetical protein
MLKHFSDERQRDRENPPRLARFSLATLITLIALADPKCGYTAKGDIAAC